VAVLSEEAVSTVRALAVASTTPRRMGSTPVAGAFYVAAGTRPGLLPAGLEERVLAGGRLPPSVVRQVREGVTGDVHLRARGAKRAALDTVMTPRGNTYVDERGREVVMLPGDFYNADDMHLNLPFWSECSDESDPCAARWGCRVGRAQLLCAQDMASGRIIGHTIWAARSDAYGTYAILWFFRRLMGDVGKPRRGWKLEHGAWASRQLREALGALDMHVEHAQTAKGKRIEAVFGRLQTIMSMLAAGSGLELGRLRGEFEEGKRLWLDMRGGKIDPRSRGVPHISEMSALVERACALYNARVSHGELLRGVSPDAAWEAGVAGRALAPLTEREGLLLLPQCSDTSLSGGLAKCRHKTFGADVWWYGNEALFAALGPGYKVRVRYDVAAPDEAAVYSRETSEARMKTRGWLAGQVPGLAEALGWTEGRLYGPVGPGEYLGRVMLQQRAPAFVMAQWEKWRAGHEYRKAYHKCVRALYRGATHLADEAHDGRGGSERVEGAHRAASAGAIMAGADENTRGDADAGGDGAMGLMGRGTNGTGGNGRGGAPVSRVVRVEGARGARAVRESRAGVALRARYGGVDDIFADAEVSVAASDAGAGSPG
jgi:hypothetical protein